MARQRRRKNRHKIKAHAQNSLPTQNNPAAATPSIRSTARAPLTHAAAGLATVMLTTSALGQSVSDTTLPTLEVQGESGGGYQGPVNTGITRLPVPIRDTPQTINVVPQQVIQDQRLTTMEDALRTVPGITFMAGEGGQQGDSPIIRGFAARGDLFRDGMRDPGWYTRDLFNADRVEVYKGPSAFAFGRGATGGAINTVTKLPTGQTFLEGTFTGTTGPGMRAEVDASGQKGNISGRVAALAAEWDTPTRDNVWTKRWGLAPSITAQVTDDTKVTLSYIYQGEEGAPDYGFTFLPTPAYDPKTGALTNPGYYGNGQATPPIPTAPTNWFGVATGPLRDITTTETHVGTFKIERDITDKVKLSNATRYIDNERFSRPTSLRTFGFGDAILGTGGARSTWGNATFPANADPNNMTIGRERRERQTNNTYFVNQTDLVAKFDTWSWSHTLAAGLEFTNETRHQDRRDICDPAKVACRENVMNPYPIGSPTGGTTVVMQPIDTRANNQAAFVSDQVKINKYFELLGSVRFDRFASVYEDLNQTTIASQKVARTDNMLGYRFGAVGHPTENSSLYIAYGNSFNPSAELGTITNGNTTLTSVASLAPEQTRTIEAGAKVDVLKNRLSLSGAIFRIEKTNLRIADPFNNTVSILDGIARVDGIELAAVGKVTDKWSVFSGYSYLESIILDTSDLSQLGRHLPNTPRHNLNIWTTYDLTPKWTIGGGATYQSFAYASTANVSYVPDFWKFDAMVSYKVTDKSTLQLNIYNITNELYYSQYSGGNVVPASGRWAALTYKIRW